MTTRRDPRIRVSMSAPNETVRELISASKIDARIKELGSEISRDYAGKELIAITVLKGSFIFAADLVRAIDGDIKMEFFGVRSYGDGTVSSGAVEITSDLRAPIDGKDVLVIEDIVDTGLTLSYMLENLMARKPRTLKVASLLHKPARTKIKVPVDYLGFTIDDVFVVGYGLDHAQRLRQLPYVGVVEPS